jgi:hypothetical protein
MTIDQANVLADRIREAPQLYDTPPNLSVGLSPTYTPNLSQQYPWISHVIYPRDLSLGFERRSNIYYSPLGFSKRAYSSKITQWKETVLDDVHGTEPRFVTLDDIRMMAYLGLEYARAKLEGWRYRFGYLGPNEANDIKRGNIVRTEDGQRYIKRYSNNSIPPPTVKYWIPMIRQSGFEVPSEGAWGLPEDYEESSSPVSDLLLIDSIEGADDIVTILPYSKSSIVMSGGFCIILSPETSLDENNLGNSFVVYQQRVQQFFSVWEYIIDSYGRVVGRRNIMDTAEKPTGDVRYDTSYKIDGQGMKFALKKGVSYNVFVKFDNAMIGSADKIGSRTLVSFLRTGTRTLAPRF